jgi:hypothetical protein
VAEPPRETVNAREQTSALKSMIENTEWIWSILEVYTKSNLLSYLFIMRVIKTKKN